MKFNVSETTNKLNLVIKSYALKNKKSKIIFIIISLFSMTSGVNGSELLDYIYEDKLCISSDNLKEIEIYNIIYYFNFFYNKYVI